MKVKKAIIPAAGLGTRFLPATKAQPKEMLPIVDKPAIQYIIEEAAASGIEAVLIITGRGKRAIEDHFDRSYELEEELAKKGKLQQLKQIQQISDMAIIHYLRQKETLGLGHAIYCGRKFIGKEPFAVLLGDDVVQSEKPCLLQLIDFFERYKATVIGVQPVPDEDVKLYGIIKGTKIEDNFYKVDDLIEKPQEETPSNLAISGRYIIHQDIFNILENTKPGAGGEIQLTDALKELTKKQQVYAHIFSGERYDIGDKFGYLKATIDFALQKNEIAEEFKKYLLKTAKHLS